MKEIDKKYFIIGGIVIIGIIVAVVYFLYFNKEEELFIENTNQIEEQKEEKEEEVEEIWIHITGQVINPGVVKLKEGARIIEAITEAGGCTQEADLNAVNLAYVLEDGQKLYIPKVNEENEEEEYISENSGNNVITEGKESNQKEKKKMININTATQEELQEIPGIGESTATKIIVYRNENGKFNAIEDIKNVNGIGDAKYEKMKEYIMIK